MVYPETRLTRAAAAAGARAEHGLGLLVAQGARSFRLWTGVEPDRDAMRDAVGLELVHRGFSPG
jgi:shikimate dehydrogenase